MTHTPDKKQDLIEQLVPIIGRDGQYDIDLANTLADFFLARDTDTDVGIGLPLDTEELEKQINMVLKRALEDIGGVVAGGDIRRAKYTTELAALFTQHTQVAVEPKTPNDHWVEFLKSDRGGHYLTNINTGEIRQVDTEGRLWRKNPDNGQYERFKQLEQRKPDLPPANPTNTIMKGL